MYQGVQNLKCQMKFYLRTAAEIMEKKGAYQ